MAMSEPTTELTTESKSEKVEGEEEKEEKSDKQKPLPGNGGVTDKYWWS